jgi:hypothetical protein
VKVERNQDDVEAGFSREQYPEGPDKSIGDDTRHEQRTESIHDAHDRAHSGLDAA